MRMGKIKEQVKNLLKSEGIEIDDYGAAIKSLSECVAHRLCIKAYHEILKEQK